ncbi:MAG: hypothetical protein ABR95_12825 [Sphingobacteriales bacterium BACL12 MAG-120813-bin55]|nr:MAG: hypothetical protein ABR95_12825 [Sphingobacteriales bacterium BACL12 MAG-120813-bin55]
MEQIIKVSAVTGTEPYATRVTAANHQLVLDEPATSGGKDLGATPSQTLCAALASCIGITLRMYANRKEWDTGDIAVEVELDRSGTTPVFTIGLSYSKPLSQEMVDRLQVIAGKCPVHKLLHHGNTFRYQ